MHIGLGIAVDVQLDDGLVAERIKANLTGFVREGLLRHEREGLITRAADIGVDERKIDVVNPNLEVRDDIARRRCRAAVSTAAEDKVIGAL